VGQGHATAILREKSVRNHVFAFFRDGDIRGHVEWVELGEVGEERGVVRLDELAIRHATHDGVVGVEPLEDDTEIGRGESGLVEDLALCDTGHGLGRRTHAQRDIFRE